MEPTPVTLIQMLAAREKRAARQRELIEKYGKTVISLTVVAPGEYKRTGDTAFVARVADGLVRDSFASGIIFRQAIDEITGYEFLYVLDAPGAEVKEKTVQIEETHPLGRLMDIDVIAAGGKSISRADIGQNWRKCIICGQSPAYCMRAKTHITEELLDAIKEKVERYKKEN